MTRTIDAGNQANPKVKKVGGVAYRPEFLLDAILLCDALREPGSLRDAVSRI